ncbi:hypothetical protein VTJ49DRAFT_6785 [Mycothermus thermophilus]|uniref:Uncharacterized protein n=1 Tax=Humicola insolens TaxID=85995 RepID=A0ABR3VJR6_HUMIN
MYAIECGWALDQIKVLVQAGCSVDVRRRTNSCFLLSRGGGLHHHCTPKVCKDRTECLKPTFFWRPKQTLDGSMCQTALHVAISKRKPEILEFLLGECGANRGSLQWPGEEPIPGNCVVPLGSSRTMVSTSPGGFPSMAPGSPFCNRNIEGEVGIDLADLAGARLYNRLKFTILVP